jgi:DNA anti-recombination protein RmuC
VECADLDGLLLGPLHECALRHFQWRVRGRRAGLLAALTRQLALARADAAAWKLRAEQTAAESGAREEQARRAARAGERERARAERRAAALLSEARAQTAAERAQAGKALAAERQRAREIEASVGDALLEERARVTA